jgi:DNA-binding CsgD family transcriptional regulator
VPVGVVEELIRAREAYDRREWVAAYEGLSGVDGGALHADDFAQLATAAYLVGRRNDCVQALQRAYQGHLDAGDTLAAVRCAFWLAMVLLTSGEMAVGGGWVARSQRLLEDAPEDVVERGYILIHLMFRHIFQAEFPQAQEYAVEITAYGQRFRDPDLLAMGLCAHGRLMLYSGRVREGLAMLDEAMVGVAAGEVSPIFAGQIYCSMIEACQEISDFARVAEWTTALTTWCEAQPGLLPFTGQCAAHRGQVMRVRGAYLAALDEFDRAARRHKANDDLPPLGLVASERGEVLRIRGDLDAAEAAFDQAISFGHDPQPALALLWLAKGRTAAAVGAIRRLLAEPRDPVHRTQLLPGAIEVLLAAGHMDEARPLVEEFSAVAAGFGCSALIAMAGYAAASLALADGDRATALPQLRKVMLLWGSLDSPYEAARTRVLIGRTFRELGDDGSAAAEFAAARRIFTELGAIPAAQEIDRMLTRTAAPGGLTAREVEVLRLVASGKSNQEIAGALYLSDRTVARHLSNIFAKIDVSSRTAAAAYAYERGLV